jgi:hypothetical protein
MPVERRAAPQADDVEVEQLGEPTYRRRASRWRAGAISTSRSGRNGWLSRPAARAACAAMPMSPGLVLPSLLAVIVSLAGMRFGQAVRARLRPQAFRLCFFYGLLVLGAYLALRGLG